MDVQQCYMLLNDFILMINWKTLGNVFTNQHTNDVEDMERS